MSAEEIVNPGVGRFRGFGHPREIPHDEVSDDPTMQRMILEINAGMEARRLRELNTPEGRKKAAEKAEAELAERQRAWGMRCCALPLHGFKGIHDSAEDKEIKVYTRTYDLKHKFWGIKPVGMTIWEFWDIHDPEVNRYYDANQETPGSPETSTATPPPIDSPQRTKAAVKQRKRQKSSDINSTNRVRKSTTLSPKVNKDSIQSLADQLDAGRSGLEQQMRELPMAVHASGRTTRKMLVDAASSTQQQATINEGSAPSKLPQRRPASKAKVAAKDDALLSKRSRGRPPTKRKLSGEAPNQNKTPAVKGNARVTKSQQTERRRPSAPSTHRMRTRGKGPAEPLQLP